jgi:hypothetical protein
MVQKSGTNATHASGNRLGARKGAANRIADKKQARYLLDILNFKI